MPSDISYCCRVCGFKSEDPPWGEDGKMPLYDFCPCCGVEHGYQDASPVGARKYRENWIKAGAQWENVHARPANWSLDEQLRAVPTDFL